MKFTEEELKVAFWKTFHKQGEMFFPYMAEYGEDEPCDSEVQFCWQDFLEHLKEN
ncbi:hypothetical protein LCGC14_1116910 [marine sediment metagenome]|uniref:Uncharacterized protein n=1 Tax=marine sediment metagenome TaxID=412755 RepID=A0A0F9M9W3_9ZZZZ